MKSDDILEVIFIVGAVAFTGISMISKAIRGRKEQSVIKPVRRKPPAAARKQARASAPGVEAILQDILGEKPLQTKLKESQAAQKKRQAELKQEEEPVVRLVANAEEAVLPSSSGVEYVPQLSTLKTRFDEPMEAETTELTGEGLPGFGAQSFRAMTRNELQRAIVLSEVLGPPVSLR